MWFILKCLFTPFIFLFDLHNNNCTRAFIKILISGGGGGSISLVSIFHCWFSYFHFHLFLAPQKVGESGGGATLWYFKFLYVNLNKCLLREKVGEPPPPPSAMFFVSLMYHGWFWAKIHWNLNKCAKKIVLFICPVFWLLPDIHAS